MQVSQETSRLTGAPLPIVVLVTGVTGDVALLTCFDALACCCCSCVVAVRNDLVGARDGNAAEICELVSGPAARNRPRAHIVDSAVTREARIARDSARRVAS